MEFPHILEMDMTKAYYKMARNLDYISEEIYQICLKVPKHIRLRLIGSIATHKVVEKYENKELKDILIIEDSTDEIKSRGHCHRYVLKPGNDISGQPAEIQSLCNTAWTQEIKDAFIAQINPPPGMSE